MGEITLYPGRVVVRSFSDEDTIWQPTVYELAKFFHFSLDLVPEFTMGDLFRLLDTDGVDFIEAVLDERIVPVLQEARMPPAPEEPIRIDFLRVVNCHERGQLRREFEGWGPWDEPYDGAWEQTQELPRTGAISVSLTPVNQLLELPLRYEPDLIFRNEAGVEEYRTTVDITFLAFLKAIFFDLTYYGSPAARDQTREELKRRVDEIKRGEAELIPADEVLKEIRERLDGDSDEK